jgi:hypothetical protein
MLSNQLSNKLSNLDMRVWRQRGDVCTLADSDRHLGHIVNLGVWHAFDAIHLNETGDGFKNVGLFDTIDRAKAAVEQSISQSAKPKVMAAGSDSWIS